MEKFPWYFVEGSPSRKKSHLLCRSHRKSNFGTVEWKNRHSVLMPQPVPRNRCNPFFERSESKYTKPQSYFKRSKEKLRRIEICLGKVINQIRKGVTYSQLFVFTIYWVKVGSLVEGVKSYFAVLTLSCWKNKTRIAC